jgi:CheY-like chemotaxis protein
VLFIDARGLWAHGARTNRELSAVDIGRIADACHAWRGEDADFRPYEDTPASPGFSHEDVPGFRAAADLDAIRDHDRALIPGQYIGSEPVKGDREPLDEKIARLTAGIGGWLYRPPGLRRRHDCAGRWDVLARHRICVQVATLPMPASPNARHRRRWNAIYMAVLGVLIVDDSWLFVEAARDRLEREGLRVVGVAATSAEALRRAEELRPEVVLVDVMLGGESGFELARRLAAHHRDGGPAVILISTYSAADFARPIAESPAAGFLPKQELSADAIRRIADGQPGDPPGAPAR